MLNPSLMTTRRPRFGEIGSMLIDAVSFRPTFIFSNAVAMHVHPDEIEIYLNNLMALGASSHSLVAFDAMTSYHHSRYGNRWWAWPEWFFEDVFQRNGFSLEQRIVGASCMEKRDDEPLKIWNVWFLFRRKY